MTKSIGKARAACAGKTGKALGACMSRKLKNKSSVRKSSKRKKAQSPKRKRR